MDAVKERDDDVKDLRGDIEEQGKDIKHLNKSIIRLERSTTESNRKTLLYSMWFSLAVFGFLATIVAAQCVPAPMVRARKQRRPSAFTLRLVRNG